MRSADRYGRTAFATNHFSDVRMKVVRVYRTLIVARYHLCPPEYFFSTVALFVRRFLPRAGASAFENLIDVNRTPI